MTTADRSMRCWPDDWSGNAPELDLLFFQRLSAKPSA